MESAEKALSDNYEVSWKSMTSKRVDTKKTKRKILRYLFNRFNGKSFKKIHCEGD